MHPYLLRLALVCVIAAAPVLSLRVLAADPVRPPMSKPLSPREAQAAFKLAAGLRIELVASEPQIESPVAMTFDEWGRLWVVEMRDYPNGPLPGAEPEGCIKVLEDRDGDGFFETANIFADRLLFGNGLLLWKDGVIVTAAPHVVWLRDTDGDGKANQREVLYEGFAAQNPQLRVSHPVLGMDNWVYVANGLRGGKVKRAGKPETAVLDISGRDFRFHLLRDRAEPETGQGQYGNTFDDWGRRYVCTNRNHLIPIIIAQRYLARNPYLVPPDAARDNQNPGGAARVYPLSHNWTTATFHAGTFSAACGVMIFRGTLLPESFRGCAFTCEPTGNLVHQEIITAVGAGSLHRPAYTDQEFLATPDDWCRPVSLAHGPDGALYVVDMYRAVIEHPDFMPVELKKRPDLLLGKDKGRIWRIVPDRKRNPAVQPQLGQATTAQLVQHLANPDAWWRTTAQRLLLARQDQAAIPHLRELALRSQQPLGRAHAAWMLDGLDGLDQDTVRQLLTDDSARVREQAVRLSERWLAHDAEMQRLLHRLAADQDARVRFQVALSAGVWNDERVFPILIRVAVRGGSDLWTRAALGTAVPNRAGAFLTQLLAAQKDFDEPGLRQLLEETAVQVGARRDAGEVGVALDSLNRYAGAGSEALHMAVLLGLAEGLKRRGTALGDFVGKLPDRQGVLRKQLDRLFAQAADQVVDAKTALPVRIRAAGLLAHAPWVRARGPLGAVLDGAAGTEVQMAAAVALGAHTHADVSASLLQRWHEYSPALRRVVIDSLLRQPQRVGELLAAVADGRLRAADIDVLRTRQLLDHPTPDIRLRARNLLTQNLPADRQEVLARYREALRQPGDAKRGRDVFRKHCIACHRLENVGHTVGPDISDLHRTKTLDVLLADVLNPNAAIDGNYVNYTVTTKSGKTFSGVLVAEAAGSLTLRRADDQNDLILRQDVEEIVNSGISLMPDGFEKSVTIPEMADLLAYLKNWRYLDAKGK